MAHIAAVLTAVYRTLYLARGGPGLQFGDLQGLGLFQGRRLKLLLLCLDCHT